MSCTNSSTITLTGSPPQDRNYSNVAAGNASVSCNLTARPLADLQLQIDALANEVANIETPGGGGNVLANLTPTLFYPSSFTPNASILDTTGEFTKSLDLGINTTAAWVKIAGRSTINPTALPVIVDGLTGSNTTPSTQPLHTVYVTEDYSQTTRWSAISNELNPSSSLVGLSSLKKTYAQLGGFVFGTYVGAVSTPRTVVFGLNLDDAQQFYVRAMYLDNTSGPTTQLVFDFVKLASTGAASFSNFDSAIVVYPVN